MIITALFAVAFALARNGVPQADIVIPEKAGMTEKYAAEELKYHLDRITGGSFSVIGEGKLSGSSHKSHVFIGATAAAKAAGLLERPYGLEERRLATRGNGLYLLGGDRDGSVMGSVWAATCHGTLYAVYDFLEKEGGVKWIWPGELGEVIPRKPDFSFPAIDRSGVEPLERRDFSGFITSLPSIEGKDSYPFLFNGFADRAVRRRYYADVKKFMLRHRVGARKRIYCGHTFGQYWKRFGKTHPEYFNLLPNGRREPLKGDEDGTEVTMCVSEPGLWKQVAADGVAWLRKNSSGATPWEPYVNCCENDTPGMCTCSRCRAWDPPDPRFAKSDYWNLSGKDPLTSHNRFPRLCDVRWGELGTTYPSMPEPPDVSDRYLNFYNNVLAEVRKILPEGGVCAYAYSNYAAPPVRTKVADGVLIEYVPRTYFPYSAEESRHLRREWDGWRKAGAKKMSFRPNYLHAGGNFPLDSGRRMTADFAYAAKRGMVICYFDSLRDSWATQTAMYYSLLRVIRDPDCTYERSLAELTSAFGPAAGQVRRYFAFIEKFCDSITYDRFRKIGYENHLPGCKTYPGGGHNCWAYVVADLYPDSFFAEGEALLAAARRAARKDATVLRRVEFLCKGLKDAKLTREVRKAQKAWNATGRKDASLKAKFEESFRVMREYRASIEGDNIANYDVHGRPEKNMGWPYPRAD